MTKRNRILTIIGVGTVLISAEMLISRSAKRAASDFASAIAKAAPVAEDLFKGTLGQALLENRRVQGIPADQQAVRSRVPDERHDTGLIDEYQKNPEKFHRYAQVFDTWVNAQKVAMASTKGEPSAFSESSLSAVGIIPDEKLDAWKHPLCVIRGVDRIVIVSGGPEAAGSMDCRLIRMSKAQISATALSSTKQRPDGSLVFTFSREDLKSR